ncbi:MAG TPA: alanine racemase, partial [Chondromyces sp.]|nr:alanine racemase [Chondromyces sp.]
MSGQKSFHRDTWAEINLDSVKYNVQETIKRLREGTSLFAVVKANAYGHGAKQVADTAVEAGASGLAVAFLDEALSLRNQGIQSPILVLGASRPEDAPVAVKHSISLTVFDLGWLKKAQTSLSSGDSLNVHVKLDTGMGRLGIKTKKDLAEMVDFLTQSDVMNFEGIFTHFATADELDDTYFNQQFERFNEIIQSLEVKPPFIHCANSATTLRFTQAHMNGVRLGISMYGLSPSNDIKPVLPFKL